MCFVSSRRGKEVRCEVRVIFCVSVVVFEVWRTCDVERVQEAMSLLLLQALLWESSGRRL